MPGKPTLSTIHTDEVLNDLAIAYVQSEDVFAHNAVFPRVPVPNSSDKYKVFERDDFYRDDVESRARGTVASESGFGNVSDDSFDTKPMDSLSDVIDPDDAADADEPVQLLRRKTRKLTHQHLIHREKDWVNSYLTSSAWNNVEDGSTGDFTQFGDSSSTPVKFIKTQRDKLNRLSGNAMNTELVLVLGPEVLRELEENSAITDRISNNDDQIATIGLMERLFKVDRIVVARAVENTKEEGDGRSMSYIHGKDMLLAKVAQDPGIDVPSAGYNFVWDQMPGGGAEGFRTKRYTVEEKNNSTKVEIDSYNDFKATAADLGVLMQNAIS